MTIEMQVLADYLDPNHPFLITVSTTAMHINKELIVHFVDISAIVDHPCFKLSFHNSHILNKR
jgi:hypothetical protein